MNSKDLKFFLRFLKDNKMIEKYEYIFGELFDYDKLLDLSSKDMTNIIFSNSVIKLYEAVNNVKFDDNIVKYIKDIKDMDLRKYCIKLVVSNKFNKEDLINYITIINNSNNKYTANNIYSIVMNDKVSEKDDCFKYVKLVSEVDSNIGTKIRDLILSNTDDELLLTFCKTVGKAKEEYTADYMIDLYKELVDNDKDIPLNHISMLLFSNGRVQTMYASLLLRDEKFMENENSLLLTYLIASSKYPYQAANAYNAIKNEDIMDSCYAYTRIFEIVKTEKQKECIGECEFKDLLKERNLDKLIESLSNVNSNEVDLNTKVKIYK